MAGYECPMEQCLLTTSSINKYMKFVLPSGLRGNIEMLTSDYKSIVCEGNGGKNKNYKQCPFYVIHEQELKEEGLI
jgi:hypothetical protein